MRAKQHWLKEGDGNTNFFHAMANGRSRTNHIGVIEDERRRLDRENDKSVYFYNKFKERFASDNNIRSALGDWSDLFSDRAFLSLDNLTVPFSTEEIKKATFQLSGDKAPGPAGFSLVFFQKFWEVISADLLKIFDDLFDDT